MVFTMVLIVNPWLIHGFTMVLIVNPWLIHGFTVVYGKYVVDMWFDHVLFIVNPWFIYYFTIVLTFDGKPMVEIRFYNGSDCKSMVLLWF